MIKFIKNIMSHRKKVVEEKQTMVDHAESKISELRREQELILERDREQLARLQRMRRAIEIMKREG